MYLLYNAIPMPHPRTLTHTRTVETSKYPKLFGISQLLLGGMLGYKARNFYRNTIKVKRATTQSQQRNTKTTTITTATTNRKTHQK